MSLASQLRGCQAPEVWARFATTVAHSQRWRVRTLQPEHTGQAEHTGQHAGAGAR